MQHAPLVAQVAPLHHSSALLVKYRISPDNQQGWFLPNDDLHHLEHPEQAAKRIHNAGKCSWRAEMVRDRRIATSRGICSPRMGQNSPSETCSGKVRASDNVEPEIAQQEPPESQDFIAAVLR